MNASRRDCIVFFIVVAAMAALAAMAMCCPWAKILPMAIPGSQTAPGARQAEGESPLARAASIVKPAGEGGPDDCAKRDGPAEFRTIAGDSGSEPQDAITDQDEREINRCMRDIQRVTGVPTAVVTLRSTGGSDAHELAATLFNSWGPVKKNRGKGLLLLFVAEPPQRGVLVESGSELEEAAAEEISRILRQQPLPPYPENAAWREEVVRGVRAVRDYLVGRSRDTPRPGPSMVTAAGREDWED